MQFFERQNTITNNQKTAQNFYKTDSGQGSAFSSKSDPFENDNFNQSMRETKMEFFFAENEAYQSLKPSGTRN